MNSSEDSVLTSHIKCFNIILKVFRMVILGTYLKGVSLYLFLKECQKIIENIKLT